MIRESSSTTSRTPGQEAQQTSSKIEDALGLVDPSTAKDNEEKVLAWLFNNPSGLDRIQESDFNTSINKTLFRAIQIAASKNLKPDLQTMVAICARSASLKDITFDFLSSILDTYPEAINIEFAIKTLKDDNVGRYIANELFAIINDASLRSSDKILRLRNRVQKITEALYLFDDENQLFNAPQLSEEFIKILDKRMENTTPRTLGSSKLDLIHTRPAHPGQMSAIVGDSGGGKSIFVMYLEENLVAKKVCVLKLSPEMDLESNIDRKVSMLEGIDIGDMQLRTRDSTIYKKLLHTAKQLANQKNYMFSPDPYLSFDKIGAYISRSREYFRANGVLPQDEYMYVIIDLFDMIEDLGDMDTKIIKKCLNRTLAMAKAEKVFVLLVVQTNENRFRSNKPPARPEDVYKYYAGLYDIEGSAAYKQRCRSVIALNRPLLLKRRFFPDQMERWDIEDDDIIVDVVKQNEGGESRIVYSFEYLGKGYKISPKGNQ